MNTYKQWDNNGITMGSHWTPMKTTSDKLGLWITHPCLGHGAGLACRAFGHPKLRFGFGGFFWVVFLWKNWFFIVFFLVFSEGCWAFLVPDWPKPLKNQGLTARNNNDSCRFLFLKDLVTTILATNCISPKWLGVCVDTLYPSPFVHIPWMSNCWDVYYLWLVDGWLSPVPHITISLSNHLPYAELEKPHGLS